MAVTREFLSNGANGAQIAITNTTSPGNAIHTAHATLKEEIWLWACNPNVVAVDLTIEFGGTAASDRIVVSLPAKSGDYLVVGGKTITNSRVIAAYASSSGVNVGGHVNRLG
jgi:hypothetical protein